MKNRKYRVEFLTDKIQFHIDNSIYCDKNIDLADVHDLIKHFVHKGFPYNNHKTHLTLQDMDDLKRDIREHYHIKDYWFKKNPEWVKFINETVEIVFTEEMLSMYPRNMLCYTSSDCVKSYLCAKDCIGCHGIEISSIQNMEAKVLFERYGKSLEVRTPWSGEVELDFDMLENIVLKIPDDRLEIANYFKTIKRETEWEEFQYFNVVLEYPEITRELISSADYWLLNLAKDVYDEFCFKHKRDDVDVLVTIKDTIYSWYVWKMVNYKMSYVDKKNVLITLFGLSLMGNKDGNDILECIKDVFNYREVQVKE